MKCTGKQWKDFYTDNAFWPDGTWHEDETVKLNGEIVSEDFDLTSVDDTDVLSITGGIVLDLSDGTEPSLESYLKKWLKKQNNVSIVFSVPKALEAVVKEAVNNILKNRVSVIRC